MSSINYVPFQTIIPSHWLNDIDQGIYEGVALWGVASGADLLVVTLSPVPEDYFNGMLIGVRVAAANTTTTPTINCNGLGLKNIKREGNRALLVGDFPRAGYEALLRFSTTTDCFELLNPGHEEFIPSGTDAVPSSVQDELDRHIISSLRFMSEVQRGSVLGSGGTDVTTPLQKWIDYLETHTASGLWVAGNYLQSDTLTIEGGNITLLGQGRNTKLYRTGDFGDSIHIKGTGPAPGGAFIEHVGIFDILLAAEGLTTSGSLLRVDGLRFGEFRGIHLKDGFEQITVEGATQLMFRHIYGVCTNLFGGVATGRTMCRFKGGDGINSPVVTNSAIYMSDYNFSGNPTTPTYDYAMSIERESDGHFMSNGHIGSAAVACLLIDSTGSSVGHQIGLVFFNGLMTDKCGGTGITFRGGTGAGEVQATSIFFSNGQLRGGAGGAGANGVNGIHFESSAGVNGVAFSNFQVCQFARRAVFVESTQCTDLFFSNPMFQENGVENVAVTAGAFVVGETYRIISIGTTDFTLIGATANTVGFLFKATGVGSGTGTAALTYTQVEFGAGCGFSSFVGGKIGGKVAGGVSQNKSAFKFNDTSTAVSVQGVKCNLNAGNQAFEGIGDGSILMDNPFLDELEVLTIPTADVITVPLGHDFAITTGTTTIETIKLRPHEAGPLMLRFDDNVTVRHMTNVTAGSFVPGKTYVIRAIGTTDFTLIGASANTIGVMFTATGVGVGTGIASLGNLDLGGGDFAATADVSTLTLICDNRTLLRWYKVAST